MRSSFMIEEIKRAFWAWHKGKDEAAILADWIAFRENLITVKKYTEEGTLNIGSQVLAILRDIRKEMPWMPSYMSEEEEDRILIGEQDSIEEFCSIEYDCTKE